MTKVERTPNSWILKWLPLALFAFMALATQTNMAWAFTQSEDEAFAAAVREAKTRARDFVAYQERVAREEEARGRGVEEIKEKRRRDEEAQEVARREYVRNRPDLRAKEEEQRRLEIKDEERIRRFEERQEQTRESYLVKRERIRQILENEAAIDEAAEYGLKERPKPVSN